jgi:hypothetical protein
MFLYTSRDRDTVTTRRTPGQLWLFHPQSRKKRYEYPFYIELTPFKKHKCPLAKTSPDVNFAGCYMQCTIRRKKKCTHEKEAHIKPVLTLKKAIPVILTTSILLAGPRKTEEGRVYDSKPYFGSCILVLKILEFCS